MEEQWTLFLPVDAGLGRAAGWVVDCLADPVAVAVAVTVVSHSRSRSHGRKSLSQSLSQSQLLSDPVSYSSTKVQLFYSYSSVIVQFRYRYSYRSYSSVTVQLQFRYSSVAVSRGFTSHKPSVAGRQKAAGRQAGSFTQSIVQS